MSDVLWQPSRERIASSLIEQFSRRTPVAGAGYQALWDWSTTDLAGFWSTVWDQCGVVADEPPSIVLGDETMPGAHWFEGARLNIARNVLARIADDEVALIAVREASDDEVLTGRDLRRLVARVQHTLTELGVGVGDRVAGVVPNTVETVTVMLAASSIGAVWSSCSPDFGVAGIVDRLAQIRPRVLVTVDGTRHGGRVHPLGPRIAEVLGQLPTVEHVILAEHLGQPVVDLGRPVHRWDDVIADGPDQPRFVSLPFDHPLFVMYSSGTTGRPKCIVHGAGGTLLQHLKEHQLHCDVHPGDRVFWFTTCGWMMWNWLVTVPASGAAAVLVDGSAAEPDLGALWRMAHRTGVTHFGTSPRFLRACELAGVTPSQEADLGGLRAVLSTGSPLQPEQFDWVYEHVHDDVHLASISGGTDILGCFVLGVPTLPVRRGRIQARGLGMAVDAWDPEGRPVRGQRGELVCTQPFPSMPVSFWDDPDARAYHDAYFAAFPGVWTHGDWITLHDTGEVVIHGRSDTTLNPGGVRIGTAEIYRAVEQVPGVADSVVVGRHVDGDVEVVLFVQLDEDRRLDEPLVATIRDTIRTAASPRHVPTHVKAVSGIPYTRSGKKVEKAVQTVISGGEVDNVDAIANPEVLDEYRTVTFDGPEG